jgi:hypothetical protein
MILQHYFIVQISKEISLLLLYFIQEYLSLLAIQVFNPHQMFLLYLSQLLRHILQLEEIRLLDVLPDLIVAGEGAPLAAHHLL